MQALPLLIEESQLSERIDQINSQIDGGGYVLVGDISFQIIDSKLVIRTFTSMEADIERDRCEVLLRAAKPRVLDIVSQSEMLERAFDSIPVEIGLYFDNRMSAFKLCYFGDDGEVVWHHPSLE